MVAAVPDGVIALLDGWPQVGGWDDMVQLLTVDPDGGVRVCVLSRAELDTDGEVVRAVVASSSTAANLRRDGRATLAAVTSDAAVYLRLRARHLIDRPPDPLGVTFSVDTVKTDTLGIDLRGPRYFVDASLQDNENWAASRRLLEDLRGG